MSSNLLKQQFVYSETSATRIINSNQRMEEKMKELMYEMSDGNVALDSGFVEGLLADEVPPEPKASPEAIEAEARAEANRILEEARQRADQMLSEADANAQKLYEDRRAEGYRDGYAAAEQELNGQMVQMEQSNAELQERLEAEYRQKLDLMENDLVDAIIRVFDKVFHIQFEDKKEILLHLINDTLLSIESGKHFRILVSEDNWQYVDEHLEELREQLGSDVTLEVARNAQMGNTDCRIESEFGIYDCGMDLELDSLCRDIRSLCG